MARVELLGVDWVAVCHQVATGGWVRLERAVDPHVAAVLEAAAPGSWQPVPESEGGAGVRQAGLSCHSAIDGAPDVVQAFASMLRDGIDAAVAPDLPPVPAFNHAQWCRADRGQNYITPHRDPDTAGGVIAILTIRGRARFRIWDAAGSLAEAEHHPEFANEWLTEDGDLVLLRSGGWPTPTSRCPIHEAQSPPHGDRVTLTLRHNKGGYGCDYFS